MTHQLDQVFAGLTRNAAAAGSLMAIDAPGRGIVWRGAAPGLSPDSLFCIASCTKLYTTALVMQLVEAGDITLEHRAADLLPSGMMNGLCVIDGKDRSGEITVGQLLSNTSGLPDYFEEAPRGEKSLMAEIVAGRDVGWTTDDALERARRLRPRFAPGTPGRAHYSDTNFQLLGEILERVSGRDFPTLVAERISGPIGQTRTFVHGPATASRYGEIAPIRAGRRRLDIPEVMLSLGAQGGVISTLDESLGFLRAFMGGVLFEKARLAQMKAQWNRVFFPFQYGLGIMKFSVHPVLTLFRRVPPLYGHSGSSGVVMYHCPELDVWVAGTVNQTGSRNLPYQFMLRAIMALKAKAP